MFLKKHKRGIKKAWYRYSKSRFAIVGLIASLTVIFIAVSADYVSPYPKDGSGITIDFSKSRLPPSWEHLAGTDLFGRDILSRIFFGFRYSLGLAMVVLALACPTGATLGLVAGYYSGKWVEKLIMRIADVFVAVPPLILAMTISGILNPSAINSMLAITVMWWPWYTRLIYGRASSLRGEFFVLSAETLGASKFHIIFKEILPNCLSQILTKMTLDVGAAIFIGASLSFLGLGAQPPTPDLGSMVAQGTQYLPEQWWISALPAFSIVFVVLAFNLLGDGVRNVFAAEKV